MAKKRNVQGGLPSVGVEQVYTGNLPLCWELKTQKQN